MEVIEKDTFKASLSKQTLLIDKNWQLSFPCNSPTSSIDFKVRK